MSSGLSFDLSSLERLLLGLADLLHQTSICAAQRQRRIGRQPDYEAGVSGMLHRRCWWPLPSGMLLHPCTSRRCEHRHAALGHAAG